MINVVLYGALKWFIAPDMPFLNRMAVCFGVVMAVLALVSIIRPLKTPVVMPTTDLVALESSKSAKVWGIGVVIATSDPLLGLLVIPPDRRDFIKTPRASRSAGRFSFCQSDAAVQLARAVMKITSYTGGLVQTNGYPR